MSALMQVDKVIELLLDGCVCLAGNESVDLRLALGRTLAEDIVSAIDVPLVSNSAMDGYAFKHEGVEPGAMMAVSARIPAGTFPEPLVGGTLARIFTGAPIPPNADTVVMQEDTEVVGENIKLIEVPAIGSNVRLAGQDIERNKTLLTAGHRLKASDLGLLASVGIRDIAVKKRLNVAVMSTGDELVDPPGKLNPGQIFNSNHYTLQAMLEELGMEVVDLGLVPDDPTKTLEALQSGAAKADCILSSGGVSVGEEDHVKAAVEKLGEISLWRLAIKPGKPLAFGQVSGKPFFGLPGNPVSSFVTFMMIAKPYLLKAQGTDLSSARQKPNYIYAPAGFSYQGGSRREYLRVQVSFDEAGSGRVVNYVNQGSGVMSSVSWANGLAELEVNQQVAEGDTLRVYLI